MTSSFSEKELNEPTKIDLSVSIASWNTKDYLRDCLTSLFFHTKKIKFEVIVVDNASKDGSAEMVKEEFPQVKLIVNKENLGFSGAHNISSRIAEGKYFLILNSDTFINENSFAKMVEFLEENSKVAACAPQMLNPDLTIQPNRFHLLTPFEAFLSITNLYNYNWDYKYLEFDGNYDVEMLGGACIMIQHSVFTKIGGFDEKFLIYNEEHDLAIRIRKTGLRLHYFPLAKVCHHVGGSTKKKDSMEMMIQAYRSNMHYYKKNFSPPTFLILKTTYFFIFMAMFIRNFIYQFLFTNDRKDYIQKNRSILQTFK